MTMTLTILLPFRIHLRAQIAAMVAETPQGSFGILPRRLDCATALSPGILAHTSPDGRTRYVAIDGGVLVKAGTDVHVTAHRAVDSDDLTALHRAVEHDFLEVDAGNAAARTAVARLESGILSRLEQLHHE